MIKKEKYLALIVARKGSKGIKNKNMIKIRSKHLIEWTFIEAKKSKLIDKIVLSTDCKNIIDLAKKYKILIPFIRPNYLSKDNTSIIKVVIHALNWVEKNLHEKYDNIILLQPTSPLRTAKHIDQAIKYFSKNKKSNRVKLISAFKINQKYNWLMSANNRIYCNFISKLLNTKNLRRQEFKELILPNGAIFISSVNNISSGFYNNLTLYYLMKKSDSVDIDTFDDVKKIK